MKRFFAALATWTLIFLASPGILARDGFGLLGFVALIPWALECSRPSHPSHPSQSGRRAFAIEWLAAAIGISALCIWSTYVLWITLLAVAIVPAFYVAVAGAVLRALAKKLPLALAAPAAWVSLETLRFLIEPPFGFGWMHLGTLLHATPWIAGGARVFGSGGLSWVLAAFAGGVADLVRARTTSRSTVMRRERPIVVSVLGFGPLALGLVLAATTRAPKMRDGPRVLLVQPAFEQKRKMHPQDPAELFADSVRLTRSGLEEARARGEPAPDLVAWGETMFPISLGETGLLEAYDRGARSVSWAKHDLQRSDILAMQEYERQWVGGVLFGRGKKSGAALFAPGTSFLSGVDYQGLADGDIRRWNAIVLWNDHGERAGVGGKIHLVPGGEQLCGLERLAWVRSLSDSLAGYVPDLVPFDHTRVLTIATHDGRGASFGVTVCFDNAYEDPYTEPLRRGDLDFHLVCSNEAWYEESFEYDQMVAFSRIIAIETGRTIVRATNAGITLAIGADGREVARLADGGKDRMVPGTLRVTVPVPSSGPGAPRPIYVRAEHAWQALWIASPLLFLALARLVARTRAPVGRAAVTRAL
jgi:apolipoprotein N-acyltransferase